MSVYIYKQFITTLSHSYSMKKRLTFIFLHLDNDIVAFIIYIGEIEQAFIGVTEVTLTDTSSLL